MVILDSCLTLSSPIAVLPHHFPHLCPGAMVILRAQEQPEWCIYTASNGIEVPALTFLVYSTDKATSKVKPPCPGWNAKHESVKRSRPRSYGLSKTWAILLYKIRRQSSSLCSSRQIHHARSRMDGICLGLTTRIPLRSSLYLLRSFRDSRPVKCTLL